MRVLHVISGLDPENGGPTFALAGLAEAQVRAGMDATVLATWQNQSGFPLAEQMRKRGVNVRLIGPARGKLSRHPDLRAETERAVASADVVHVHALWEEIQHQAARAAQRRGVPYVVTPHGMLSPWSMEQGRWPNRWGKRAYLSLRLRRNLNRAAAIHFTTTAERDLVARLDLRAPSIVEPVGVDLAEFDSLPPRGAFRARYASQLGQRPILLFLSRLSPQKGLDVLIPGFARYLQRSASDAVLVLVGPDYDGYGQTVRAMVKEHRVEERTIFTGMLHGKQRVEALRDAELFLLPSHHENFGIVVAEALAAGTPVIISDRVNLHPEVASAGVGGVIAPEPEALARELERWMSDPSLRRAAAERAPGFLRGRYDWNTIAPRWLGHYGALISGASTTTGSR